MFYNQEFTPVLQFSTNLATPPFEETNVAVDHNLLIMDLMEKIAIKHKFRILFDEKPFGGLNGNGKHNNWSLATSNGKNLFAPGKDPGSDLQFLTFFINVIKAIHDHNDLLRAAIASEGNDHRLGANEAPPAIISIFTGSFLEAVLTRISQVASIFSAARRRFCYKNHEVVACMERWIWHTRWVNRNRGAFGSILTAA